MSIRLRANLSQQIAFIVVAAGLALALGSFLGFHPRLRFSWLMCVRGVVIGATYFVLSTVALLSLARWIAPLRVALREATEPYRHMASFSLLGTSISVGSAEELLFRGVLFSWLSSFGLGWGLLAHFVLLFAFYFQSRSTWPWSLSKAVECSVYAIAFHIYQGVLVICVAHSLVEYANGLLYRNKKVLSLLDKAPR